MGQSCAFVLCYVVDYFLKNYKCDIKKVTFIKNDWYEGILEKSLQQNVIMTENKEKPLSQKMFKYTRSGRLSNFDYESVIFVVEKLYIWYDYTELFR